MDEDDDHLPFRPPDWAALGVHPSELLGDDELDSAPPMPGSVRWALRSPDELIWLTLAVIEPIEVDDDARPSAFAWWETVSEQIISAAFQFSALDFSITVRSWGVVFEVAFVAESYADAFRDGAAMRSAIDQLGILRLEVTSGRGGGTAGARLPRRPRPILGSGAAELPLPDPDVDWAPAFPAIFLGSSTLTTGR